MVNRPEASPQIEISRKSATRRNMAASGGTEPTVITSTEPPTMASIAGGPDGKTLNSMSTPGAKPWSCTSQYMPKE